MKPTVFHMYKILIEGIQVLHYAKRKANFVGTLNNIPMDTAHMTHHVMCATLTMAKYICIRFA